MFLLSAIVLPLYTSVLRRKIQCPDPKIGKSGQNGRRIHELTSEKRSRGPLVEPVPFPLRDRRTDGQARQEGMAPIPSMRPLAWANGPHNEHGPHQWMAFLEVQIRAHAHSQYLSPATAHIPMRRDVDQIDGMSGIRLDLPTNIANVRPNQGWTPYSRRIAPHLLQ